MKKLLFITALLFISLMPRAQVSFSVFDLSTEHASNPIGIDNPTPRFSWKTNSQRRNFTQGAYQILVSDSYDKINKNEGNIWDSGKIKSEQSVLVPFEGSLLQPAKTYYWKVKVSDDKGKESAWSTINSFTTGLYTPKDWNNAQWISLEKDGPFVAGIHGLSGVDPSKPKVGMYKLPQFRKEFTPKKSVKQALVYVSGLGHFDLFLNGEKVGNHFLDPGWTLYSKEALYVGFDITNKINDKANTFGIMLGNGFFNIPQERYFKLVTSYGAPKVKLYLKLTYDDGSTQQIVTDKSWKVIESPITYSSIFGGEDYDANREIEGWLGNGYNDKSWSTPIVSDYNPALIAQQSNPLKIKQELSVVNKYKNSRGNWVYDFGQNFSGITRLSVKGSKGQKITLIPAELITKDSLANQKATGAPSYFCYTTKGSDNVETWQPQFTYYGFRYVEVLDAVPAGEDNPNNLPEIEKLTGLHTTLSAPEVGTFHCSNPMFNKIHNLIDWATRSNMASVLTDCPHREKLGWIEQAYLTQNSIQYQYDLSKLYSKKLNDMATSQTDEGVIPTITPEYVRFEGDFEDTPEWGSAFIISQWYLYQWYGDDIFRHYYPKMKRYMDYFASKANNNILSYGLGDWLDLGPKPPAHAQLTANSLTATATYYYDATIMQKIATLLGEEGDAKMYGQLAEEIKKSYNDTFFNKETKTYDRNSQTASAISLYVGLVEDENKDQVLQNLVDDIRGRNNALTAGDIGFRYVLQVLKQNNLSNIIFDMNSKYDVPGYGWQLAKGATTLTESWQAFENLSHNHFVFAHLWEWLYGGLGGIGQAENSIAYKTVEINPQIVGDITNTRVSYESPYGTIRSEWRLDDDTYTLRVSIPANSKAIVHLPTTDKSLVSEYGIPLSQINEIKELGSDSNSMRLEVGSGDYLFEVKQK